VATISISFATRCPPSFKPASDRICRCTTYVYCTNVITVFMSCEIAFEKFITAVASLVSPSANATLYGLVFACIITVDRRGTEGSSNSACDRRRSLIVQLSINNLTIAAEHHDHGEQSTVASSLGKILAAPVRAVARLLPQNDVTKGEHHAIVPILHDVSLKFSAGESTLIIAPPGAGTYPSDSTRIVN
jgi:hypothetical protein